MKVHAAKCVKCGAVIKAANGGPAPNFLQRTFRLDDGNLLQVGTCVNCEILPEEYSELAQVHQDYFKRTGFHFDAQIVSEEPGVLGFGDFIKIAQSGLCNTCQEPLEGRAYVVTHGVAIHQECPLNPPKRAVHAIPTQTLPEIPETE